MILFFTITLGVSILGMGAILLLKRYELASGRMVMSGVRPRVGDWTRIALFWIERVLPALARHLINRLYARARHALRAAVAWSVIFVEQGLEKALHTVRHKTTVAPKADGEASQFLREVAEHKKKLQEDTPDRAIFDE